MVRFLLFLVFCVPAYGIAFGIGSLVFDLSENVFKATAANASVFAFFMAAFWIVKR
jgi:hypothetical protein